MKILKEWPQVLRFAFGGSAGTLLYYVIFISFTKLFLLNYILASIVGAVVSISLKFLFHKFYAFKDKDKERIKKQAGLYLLYSIFLAIMNLLLLYVLVDTFKIDKILSQIFNSMFLTIFSYTFARLIFRSSP